MTNSLKSEAGGAVQAGMRIRGACGACAAPFGTCVCLPAADPIALRRAENLLALTLQLAAKPLRPREQALAEGVMRRDVETFLQSRGWVWNALNREWVRTGESGNNARSWVETRGREP